jgi:hypothetical protein
MLREPRPLSCCHHQFDEQPAIVVIPEASLLPGVNTIARFCEIKTYDRCSDADRHRSRRAANVRKRITPAVRHSAALRVGGAVGATPATFLLVWLRLDGGLLTCLACDDLCWPCPGHRGSP